MNKTLEENLKKVSRTYMALTYEEYRALRRFDETVTYAKGDILRPEKDMTLKNNRVNPIYEVKEDGVGEGILFGSLFWLVSEEDKAEMVSRGL